MLKVWYREGNIEVLNNAQLYFKNRKKQEWFQDPLVKEMIKDVDKSEVAGPYLIISPVLGPIPPEKLSGGVQVLILMLKDDTYMYNISNCGDNCAKWILEIGKRMDITVFLEHYMEFDGDFEMKIMNTGKIVHNFNEYFAELDKIDWMIEDGNFIEPTFL